jgi:hypothetical protein
MAWEPGATRAQRWSMRVGGYCHQAATWQPVTTLCAHCAKVGVPTPMDCPLLSCCSEPRILVTGAGHDDPGVWSAAGGLPAPAFVAVRDPSSAGLEDTAALFSQSAAIGSIAYLLHGAAAALAAGAPAGASACVCAPPFLALCTPKQGSHVYTSGAGGLVTKATHPGTTPEGPVSSSSAPKQSAQQMALADALMADGVSARPGWTRRTPVPSLR